MVSMTSVRFAGGLPRDGTPSESIQRIRDRNMYATILTADFTADGLLTQERI